MTTKISVTACCDSETTEVEVDIDDHVVGQTKITETLQDEESKEFYVYDARIISVQEVKK